MFYIRRYILSISSIPMKYYLGLVGLTVAAFVFNTSEFMPIGLLIDIAASFDMSEAATGTMITVYAWCVALLSLPLMLLTCRLNLKKLMLATIALFAIGQIGSGLAVNFPMLMGSRILVACAHSIFWSIAAPMATRLVTRMHGPFALSMIVIGSSVAMIFGLPFGRLIGLYSGWRMTFLLIAGVAIALFCYLAYLLPSVKPAGTFSVKNLPALIKKPSVHSIYLIIVLYATAYFTTYSYIEPFLKNVAGFSADWITIALVLLGASGLVGSFIFSHTYGRHRFGLLRMNFIGIIVSLMVWQLASHYFNTMMALCLALGIFSTLFNVTFQAELLRNVERSAATVATSIYSGIFNLGIGGGTWIGGHVTNAGFLPYIGYVGAAIALISGLYCLLAYFPSVRPNKQMKKAIE